RGLRLLQLLGEAKPFTTTVTITVPLTNTPQIQHATATPIEGFSVAQEALANDQSISTIKGFGSDPAIYYRFDLPSGFPILGKTTSPGNLGQVIFPATTEYTGPFSQPMTNSWTSVVGKSGPDGAVFGLAGGPSVVTLDQFGGVDSTGDGLPDIARYVIGLKVGVRSFADDGIDDAAKLAAGLDPLDGRAFPTGVIASLPTTGSVESLAVDGSTVYAVG